MDRQTLMEKLKSFVEEDTGKPCPEMTDDTTLREGLELDSMDLVGIIMKVEDHFRIRLSQEELQNTLTVGQLLELLIRKTNPSPNSVTV